MARISVSRLPLRPITRAHALRPFHASSRFAARKDSQHKDSINTEASEYSKSGTDDQSAQQAQAAFEPELTDPQKEKDRAGEGAGAGSNPLDVSPANPEVSKPRPDQEGGAERGGNRKPSGGSSPRKAGSG